MHVDSTAIREIDYSPEHGKLFVTFLDGDAYVYVGVPERISQRSFALPRRAGSSSG